jgi:hypothetical protein
MATTIYFTILIIVISLVASIFLCAAAWAAVAVTRMIQISISLDVTLARELSAIQQSLANRKTAQPAIPTPSSEPAPNQEGEFYAYDESLMSDLETIRKLRQERGSQQGGLTDEELQDQIASVKAAGFDENEK